MESQLVLNLLFWIALSLLILVSSGVLYLTILQWNDRRRRERDKRDK